MFSQMSIIVRSSAVIMVPMGLASKENVVWTKMALDAVKNEGLVGWMGNEERESV